jgi:hypothetical protein
MLIEMYLAELEVDIKKETETEGFEAFLPEWALKKFNSICIRQLRRIYPAFKEKIALQNDLVLKRVKLVAPKG